MLRNSSVYMEIEVAYARQDTQVVVSLQLEAGSTVQGAIIQSGLLEKFPEIDLTINKVGIFGRLCELERLLHTGDRVEIYRPLLTDPKEARRHRKSK